MGDLKLTSYAFSDGGEIPREYGYKNGNAKPPLAVSGIPEEGNIHLVLIMDDPDAMGAVGKVWLHWIVWDIVPTMKDYMDKFPDTVESGGAGYEGINDFGEEGYGGPAPPDKRHTYVFKVYAVDGSLEGINSESTRADVEKAMEGHIIEQASLTGTYAP